jgi:hypothetical protein
LSGWTVQHLWQGRQVLLLRQQQHEQRQRELQQGL